MNTQDLTYTDWESARAAGHTLVMVVELGLISPELRLRLFAEHSLWPLLQQPQVAHLTTQGPALIELSDQPFAKRIEQQEQLPRSAQHGWLSSRLNMIDLQKHLGDALACRNIDGEILLIRSYAHNVLPALYARPEQAWHSWLFGPIVHWWLPTTQGWQRIDGLAQADVPAYHSIELDQRLVDELGTDPHAQALVAELQNNAPQVFTSECHGERLSQAGHALSQAQEAGLTQQQDQYFYALYSLLSGAPLSQSPDWPGMLQRVEHEGLELAQVQQELEEQG